jgi:hypothetical protein
VAVSGDQRKDDRSALAAELGLEEELARAVGDLAFGAMWGDPDPEFTASRENRRHRRPVGYAAWRPQRNTRKLLGQVEAVLEEYADHLPLSVRQIFYRLVAAHGYEKTERAYNRLGEHLGRARRARLVPFEAIRDDGVITASSTSYRGIPDFEDETARRAKRYRRDRQAGQPVRVELWCEAAGMLHQLDRVAGRFSVPVFSSGGFVSLTAMRQIADRALERQVPTVLLHVGDLDPSGESVFDRIAEDAAAFVEADRHLATLRVEAKRVALTREQVAEHNLPEAPAKRSDSRSRGWQGGTCQLEALPPDVLAGLVEAAIVAELDMGRFERVLGEEAAERAQLLGLPSGERPG